VTLERQLLQANEVDKEQVGKLSIYSLFEARRLADGIGYIRFTTFIEAMNKKIRAAIESMRDASGLIIDLRGNGGGEDQVAINMAGMLFDKQTQLMITKTNKGEDKYYQAKPQKNGFLGTVVILVDEGSGSASEQFAAGMQEVGRAFVIGKTTAGEDMDADLAKLPTGAYLVYAYGLPRTPKGVVIEGRGVIPNTEVSLTRAELLKGNDSQLNAAIEYIQKQKK
jgi:carboxyl-terminal processing protease